MSRKKALISELDLSKIGGRIAYLRLSNGLTQAEFSKKTGISRGNVSGLESNKYEPSAKAIVKLVELFNVTADWILFGDKVTKTESEQIPTQIIEPLSDVILDHIKIIKCFENPKEGRDANKWLIDLQNLDKELYRKAISSIKKLRDVAKILNEDVSGFMSEENTENMDEFYKQLKKLRREGGKKERKTGNKDE